MWWSILKGHTEGGNLTGRSNTTNVPDSTIDHAKKRMEMLAPWISGATQENYQGVNVRYNHGLITHIKNLKSDDNIILFGYYLRNYLPKMLNFQKKRFKEPANPFKQQTRRGPFQTPIKDDKGNILGYIIWESGAAIKLNFLSMKEAPKFEVVELGTVRIEDAFEQNETAKEYFEGV
mgnify:FL=1